MHHALKRHPDSHCTAATGIEANVARTRSGNLVLQYAVTGIINEIRIPALTDPVRSDNLWRHTCFEVFIRAATGSAYFEFNLVPSTQWAAYRFSGYRSGMTAVCEIDAPRISVRSDDGCWSLRASLDLGQLPDLPGDAGWRLGLSAIIEETNGRISHWALAHPPGQADFHHFDCFALELPAASHG
jgi:hypothetical protein